MATRRRAGGISKSIVLALTEAQVLASPLGQTAVVLAAMVDDPETPATARVAAAKQLQSALAEATRSAVRVADPVDELRSRREARLRGA